MESQVTLQQNESAAQMLVTQESQPDFRRPPVEHSLCVQVEVVHVPAALHVCPEAQVPQVPPQPSGPQVLPVHCGVQTPPPRRVPLGVPLPVGPSQPAAALQSALVQVPLEPLVTSKNCDGFAYEYDGPTLPFP